MASEFRCNRIVAFHETDMAGIVHFAVFFQWMEATEHEFLRSLGLSVMQEHQGRTYGWPRVAVSCDYFLPIRFEDTIEQDLLVVKKGRKSITYGITFLRNGQACARGRVTAVCCRQGADHSLEAVEIPAFFGDKIEVAPARDDEDGAA